MVDYLAKLLYNIAMIHPTEAIPVKCPFTWAALLTMCLRVNHFALPTTLAGYRLTPTLLYCNEIAPGREVIVEPPAYGAYLCLTGSMQLAQRREHRMTPGMVWLQPPGQRDRWLVGPQGFFYFYMHFTVEPTVPNSDHSAWPVWPWAIRELAISVEESQLNLPGWPERAGLRATAWLSRCGTLFGNLDALPPSPYTFQFLTAAVDRYCLTHLAHPVRLQEIADHLGISARTLIRRYHKETGSTVIARLMTIRLQVAADLLLQTGLSLTDIASQVGISDTKYFIRVFHQRYGSSPMRYRQAQRASRSAETVDEQ